MFKLKLWFTSDVLQSYLSILTLLFAFVVCARLAVFILAFVVVSCGVMSTHICTWFVL